MPSLPPVAGVLKTNWHFQIGEDTAAENVIHLGYTGTPPDTAGCVSVANTIMASWASAGMQGNFGTWAIFEQVFVEDLSSNTGAVGLSTHAAIPGTDGSGVGSAASCVLVHATIARRYRGGKPRTYFSGIQGTRQNDAQTWQTSFIASFQTNLTALYGLMSGITVNSGATTGPVSVSYYHGSTVVVGPTGRAKNVPTLRPSPIVDPITSWTAEVKLASQRRRLLRSP